MSNFPSRGVPNYPSPFRPLENRTAHPSTRRQCYKLWSNAERHEAQYRAILDGIACPLWKSPDSPNFSYSYRRIAAKVLAEKLKSGTDLERARAVQLAETERPAEWIEWIEADRRHDDVSLLHDLVHVAAGVPSLHDPILKRIGETAWAMNEGCEYIAKNWFGSQEPGSVASGLRMLAAIGKAGCLNNSDDVMSRIARTFANAAIESPGCAVPMMRDRCLGRRTFQLCAEELSCVLRERQTRADLYLTGFVLLTDFAERAREESGWKNWYPKINSKLSDVDLDHLPDQYGMAARRNRAVVEPMWIGPFKNDPDITYSKPPDFIRVFSNLMRDTPSEKLFEATRELNELQFGSQVAEILCDVLVCPTCTAVSAIAEALRSLRREDTLPRLQRMLVNNTKFVGRIASVIGTLFGDEVLIGSLALALNDANFFRHWRPSVATALATLYRNRTDDVRTCELLAQALQNAAEHGCQVPEGMAQLLEAVVHRGHASLSSGRVG